MRKIILFLLTPFLLYSLFISKSYAIQELSDVGIAKYAVLEVLENYTPIRLKPSEAAARLGHVFERTVLFADKQNQDYYRIELKNKKYAWVNKKAVEVQAIIPEKRFEQTNKITFKNESGAYQVKIDTGLKSAFVLTEEGNNLSFTLYDNHFDPIETKIISKNKKFKLPDKIQNELNIKYLNDKPLFGYGVINDETGYILNVKKTPKVSKRRPLKNMVIVVDPGHGGYEAGCCAFNLEEKNINLEISKKLKRELEKRGARVYLTRKNDTRIPLYDRIDFAKEKQADILLSIHQNSLANPKNVDKKHGTGTYYYHAQSRPLAQKIKDSLVDATGFRDDGVNYSSLALVRPSEQISVLVECGYLIRKEEAQKLSDKKFQVVVAKAIVKGCEDYLRDSFRK